MKKGEKYELVGYAECAYEIAGSDNWMNQRYFEKRDMRPLFVEELAVHPDYHGRGVGSFMFEQIEHAARLRGCTHLVLEVAENNERRAEVLPDTQLLQARCRDLPREEGQRRRGAAGAAQDHAAETGVIEPRPCRRAPDTPGFGDVRPPPT